MAEKEVVLEDKIAIVKTFDLRGSPNDFYVTFHFPGLWCAEDIDEFRKLFGEAVKVTLKKW